MNHNKISFLILAILFTLYSCEKNELSDQPELTASIDDIDDMKAAVEIKLSTGNIISFYDLNRDGLKGVFIVENGNCSDCSALDNLAQSSKTKLSEQEIFWALSEPRVSVPSFLKTSSNNKNHSKPQGWARNITKAPTDISVGHTIACYNQGFTNNINGYSFGEPEFIALDKSPENYSAFANDCNNSNFCDNGPRYRFEKRFDDVKEVGGKICARSVQNSSNNHNTTPNGWTLCYPSPCPVGEYHGPKIYLEYLWDNVWRTISDTEIPANTTRTLSFTGYSNVKISFRLRVKDAMEKDQFDLMADVRTPEEVEPSPLPPYVSIGGPYLIVDFNETIDTPDGWRPQITIPGSLVESYINDNIRYIPYNFCGIRIKDADSFQWQTPTGTPLGIPFYSDSTPDQYIQFTGPIGNCNTNNVDWNFGPPLTTGLQTINYGTNKLVIEIFEEDTKIQFLY